MRRSRLAVLAIALVAALSGGVVAPAVAGRGVTVDQVYSAPVPSLCQYPAGRLVNGVLPGTSPGVVRLAGRRKIVVGVLQARHRAGAAAVVSCNRGGVPWPDNIVLYTPRLKVLGTVRLLRVNRGSEETRVRRLWIDGHRNVHAQVVGVAENGDCDGCAQTGELLVFHHSAAQHTLVITTKRVFTERPTARGFVAAVNHHNRAAASKYGTKAAVRAWFPVPPDWKFSLRGCYGRLSSEFPNYLNPPDNVMRACIVDEQAPSGSHATPLYMVKTGWNRWRVAGPQGN